jgi:hypothetical protein
MAPFKITLYTVCIGYTKYVASISNHVKIGSVTCPFWLPLLENRGSQNSTEQSCDCLLFHSLVFRKSGVLRTVHECSSFLYCTESYFIVMRHSAFMCFVILIVLYHSLLYCAILHCTVPSWHGLLCAILHSALPFCIGLCHTALRSAILIVLYHSVFYCAILR